MFNFRKQKTVGEVEKDFKNQYPYVKISLANYIKDVIKNAYEKAGIEFDEKDGILAVGIVEYLTGNSIEEWVSRCDDESKPYAQDLSPLVEGKANEIMAADKSVREIIVYTLRMDFTIKASKYGAESIINTDYGVTVNKLLQQYGKEFPEEVSPEKYDLLVRNFLIKH